MSDNDNVVTPEASVSGSFQSEDGIKTVSVLKVIPSPRDILEGAAVQGTLEIRQEVRTILQDPVIWDHIHPMLRPQGKHGSVQFDHMGVAQAVYDNSEKLRAVTDLDMFSLWHHIAAVLKKLKYDMQRGYIVGFIGDIPENGNEG